MAIPIPDDVRELLQAPNCVHLSTLRADGSPHTGSSGQDSRTTASSHCQSVQVAQVPAAGLGTPGAKDGAVSAPALKPGT